MQTYQIGMDETNAWNVGKWENVMATATATKIIVSIGRDVETFADMHNKDTVLKNTATKMTKMRTMKMVCFSIPNIDIFYQWGVHVTKFFLNIFRSELLQTMQKEAKTMQKNLELLRLWLSREAAEKCWNVEMFVFVTDTKGSNLPLNELFIYYILYIFGKEFDGYYFNKTLYFDYFW